MTDERFVALETVKERSSIAKGAHYRGRSSKSTVPSVDNLSKKEIRDKSGHVIFYSMDRPMSFEKFTNLGADIQKDYIQRLISVYGGDTGKISKMFGITEARVKKFREELDISSRCSASGSECLEKVWKEFLEKGDYLTKPMTWESFKKLDWYDQTQYIQFLTDTMGVTIRRISIDLFDLSYQTVLSTYLRRHSISYYQNKTGHMSEEQIERWEEWLGKKNEFVGNGSITRPEATILNLADMLRTKTIPEEPVVAQPVIFENLDITVKASSWEDLAEKIKTLPLSKHGVIRFEMEEV